MISPHTPPGTRIVCVDAVPHGKYSLCCTIPDLDGLTKGEVYTVDSIQLFSLSIDGLIVILREISRPINVLGFSLARFKLAPLPRCLTELLDGVPIKDVETVL